MGTKTTSSKNLLASSIEANSMVFADSVAIAATGDVDLADVIQPVRVSGGTDVHRVVIKCSAALAASALAAKIGFTPVDGSTPAVTSPTADVAVSAAAAFGLNTNNVTFEVFPPYRVEKDSYLNIVVTTAGVTPAAGTVYAKVEGEGIGMK